MRIAPIGHLTGAALVALGALSIVEGLRLRDDWQGAKLMPVLVGVVLVVLGIAHVATRVREAPAIPERAALRRVALVLAVVALYVGALPYAGFLPATALLVLALVRALGAYGWPRVIVATIAIAVACEVVFRRWLGMPLP